MPDRKKKKPLVPKFCKDMDFLNGFKGSRKANIPSARLVISRRLSTKMEVI